MTISKNLRKLMELHGLSANSLADLSGVPQPTISRILKGDHSDPRTNTLQKLAAALNCTAEQLRLSGAEYGPQTQPAAFNSLNDGKAEYLIPNAGEGFTRIDIPTLNIVEWVTLDELLRSPMLQKNSNVDGKPRVFGLKIQDDTNEPKLMQGSIVEINMDREPKPGDFVLARYDVNTPPTIKQFIQDGGRTFLKPFNPRYPIITPTNLEILGVIQRKIVIEDF